MSGLEILTEIKAFVLDVDGVMTDGQLLLTEDGNYLRSFNIRDGYAIRKAIEEGFKITVISGGKSLGVQKRLSDLGLKDIYLGVNDKLPVLLQWMQKEGIDSNQLAYMGDDILDLPCYAHAALKACPQDAAPEIRSICNYISGYHGGKGCVRDLIEKIMKSQNTWM